MILQAQEGHYLTENFEVKERRFIKSVNLIGIDEAKYWKEVTEQEAEAIKKQEELLNVNVTYQYLQDVKVMLQGITNNINAAGLTSDEALEMQDFYPKWDNILGTSASEGFRFNYQGTLLEVVTPLTLTGDNPPVQRPMMLPELSDGNMQVGTIYYKVVSPTPKDNVKEDNITTNESGQKEEQ